MRWSGDPFDHPVATEGPNHDPPSSSEYPQSCPEAHACRTSLFDQSMDPRIRRVSMFGLKPWRHNNVECRNTSSAYHDDQSAALDDGGGAPSLQQLDMYRLSEERVTTMVGSNVVSTVTRYRFHQRAAIYVV